MQTLLERRLLDINHGKYLVDGIPCEPNENVTLKRNYGFFKRMQLDDDIVEIRLHIITWLFDFFAWNGTGPLSAFKSPWTHLLIYRQKYLIGEILYKDDKRFLFCEENDTTTLCSLFAYLKCNED